jgi:hypothetical protein
VDIKCSDFATGLATGWFLFRDKKVRRTKSWFDQTLLRKAQRVKYLFPIAILTRAELESLSRCTYDDVVHYEVRVPDDENPLIDITTGKETGETLAQFQRRG